MTKKKTKKEIIIFTSNNCEYCKKIKDYFDEKKIKYTEKDHLKHSEEWTKINTLTGIPMFPTIVVNNEHYLVPGRDFNLPEHAETQIEAYTNDFDFSTEIRLREGFKTMVYAINQAIQHIVKLLEDKKKENK